MPKKQPAKRKTPRQVPIAIYLGTPEKKRARVMMLDDIAKRYGLNRSQLIQGIADGDFMVSDWRDISYDEEDSD